MSDTRDNGPVHGLLTACDVEGYSGRTHDEQRDIQHRLSRLHERVSSNARLTRTGDGGYVQGRGDGDLTRWPSSTSAVTLIADYLRELHAELVRMNKSLVAGNQLRLRMSVVMGTSETAEHGLAGVGPITAARLVDSEHAKRALRIATAYPLVVILDDPVYQDVVAPRLRGLKPEDYVPVLVENSDKHFKRHAWICVPGCDPSALADLKLGYVARVGAEKLVSAMATDGWERVRDQIGAVVGLHHRLDADNARLEALPADQRDAERANQAMTWYGALSAIFDEHPERADRVRDALASEKPPAAAQVNQSQNVSGVGAGANVAVAHGGHAVNVGGDVRVNPAGDTAMIAGASGAVGITGTLIGTEAAATGAGSVGGPVAATAGASKFAAIIGVPVLAAGAVATVGYGIHQHDNCGSFFGERTAIEVLDAATDRVKDSSFRFRVRWGSAFTMSGEFDNQRVAGSYRGSMGDENVEIIHDNLTIYFRLSGGEWHREDFDTTEDPRLSQGNPIKTAEYLASATGATKSSCEVHGTIDTKVLDPDTTEPPIPFDASVNPDDDLTRLKLILPSRINGESVPDELREMEWEFYDHGVQVNVTPPQVA
jgi:hypothetical protein